MTPKTRPNDQPVRLLFEATTRGQRRVVSRRRTKPKTGCPVKLRGARPAYAEQLFRSAGPGSASAKEDRANRDQVS